MPIVSVEELQLAMGGRSALSNYTIIVDPEIYFSVLKEHMLVLWTGLPSFCSCSRIQLFGVSIEDVIVL
jgi:hypothetical protein